MRKTRKSAVDLEIDELKAMLDAVRSHAQVTPAELLRAIEIRAKLMMIKHKIGDGNDAGGFWGT